MVMELRQRKKHITETVKALDAFPKMSDTYMETTRSGGTISLLVFLVMAVMVYSEVKHFMTAIKFRFEPDVDIDAKIPLNVDIIVATTCQGVSADIMDSTRSIMLGDSSTLHMTDTHWRMTALQQSHLLSTQLRNAYIREHYHGIKEQLLRDRVRWSWKSNYPAHSPGGEWGEPDACRIQGRVLLHKVAGNLHVTVRRPTLIIPGLPGLQLQLAGDFFGAGAAAANFSHRILRFQFGDSSYGLVSPLEGDELVSSHQNTMYQYFVEIVPTDVRGVFGTTHTYQYSVKNQQREVDHDAGSHGVAGLFVRYEMSPLKVVISEHSESPLSLLLRLCTLCGGLYVSAGVLNSLVGWLMFISCWWCRRRRSSIMTRLSADNSVSHQLNIADVSSLSTTTTTTTTAHHAVSGVRLAPSLQPAPQ